MGLGLLALASLVVEDDDDDELVDVGDVGSWLREIVSCSSWISVVITWTW